MSTEVGKRAEAAAADWLENQGFKVIAQNWRNRFCEIDIIAEKSKAIHFIEVKYRKSAAFGSGFEYITDDKIGRLKRAAEVWLSENDHQGLQHQIDVMSVTGSVDAPIIEYLPNAIES